MADCVVRDSCAALLALGCACLSHLVMRNIGTGRGGGGGLLLLDVSCQIGEGGKKSYLFWSQLQ